MDLGQVTTGGRYFCQDTKWFAHLGGSLPQPGRISHLGQAEYVPWVLEAAYINDQPRNTD